MVLLPNIDVIESCVQFNNYKNNRKLFNIIYNSTTSICLSRKFIDLIEENVSNRDAFQALIKELQDENRLKIERTVPKNTLMQEFIEIAKTAKVPLLIPVTIKDVNNLIGIIPFLTIFEHATPINRHWLIIELLSKNICNVSYQNFKTDKEIIKFFKEVFSIPKYITTVSIFDREQNTVYLSSIKGKHIEFYTIQSGGKQNEHIRKQTKKQLINSLGGKVKLFYTSDPRKLHERKVIFENIILTIDNSLNNITVAEPTWELTITYDSEKAKKWKDKCCTFSEVN
ncbi:hypothetical protein [Niastella sp. OAS944]|uniref:hypothetical protein n=1 Tax=Niastella sp. OAS944 TaxID=2664089 RepID=UPI0034721F90|nr:hypothetical protein [Chitinophagaceae bacterium OAS944]